MHYQNDNYAYQAFRLAVEKLNTSFKVSETRGGLEKYVEFRIFHHLLEREVFFKINGEFSEEVKLAIINAVHDEAKRLRMTVGTISA
jgi:hypothetical protein